MDIVQYGVVQWEVLWGGGTIDQNFPGTSL